MNIFHRHRPSNLFFPPLYLSFSFRLFTDVCERGRLFNGIIYEDTRDIIEPVCVRVRVHLYTCSASRRFRLIPPFCESIVLLPPPPARVSISAPTHLYNTFR